MAGQSPFSFGKRDAVSKTETAPAAAPAAVAATPSATAPRTGAFFAGAATAPGAAASFAGAVAPAETKGSTLTVGPNIKLKGVEVSDCDTLLVEGTVEATIDARVIRISQEGSFNGVADVDVVEIHGNFEGTLTAREKLTVFATGKVKGKIIYGKLVVEEGASISGEISTSASKA